MREEHREEAHGLGADEPQLLLLAQEASCVRRGWLLLFFFLFIGGDMWNDDGPTRLSATSPSLTFFFFHHSFSGLRSLYAQWVIVPVGIRNLVSISPLLPPRPTTRPNSSFHLPPTSLPPPIERGHCAAPSSSSTAAATANSGKASTRRRCISSRLTLGSRSQMPTFLFCCVRVRAWMKYKRQKKREGREWAHHPPDTRIYNHNHPLLPPHLHVHHPAERRAVRDAR